MSEREALAPYLGKRITVTGIYDRCGEARDCATALIQCVEMDGERLAGHVWLQRAETLTNLDVRRGDRVEFSALVMSKRDKDGRYTDFSLVKPTTARLLDD